MSTRSAESSLINGRKFKVTVTDHGFSGLDNERAIVEQAGGELTAFQCKTEDDVIRAARDADAILVQWAPITSSVIANLDRCKVIVRYGIGVDNVNLEAARRHGITVCNVPDYCTDEVADHTLALTLAVIRHLGLADKTVRQGIWKPIPPISIPPIAQMTLVTIGYGRTGKSVLERARSFRFHLATCDPYLVDRSAIADDIHQLTFDEALAKADVLSLHMPLTKENNHLIDANALSKMKRGALLINTARGGLVDTLVLCDALHSGQIAGAGLDVFESEPLGIDHPLLACENVILTPHIAWYSRSSVEALQRMAAEDAIRALTGEGVRSRVS